MIDNEKQANVATFEEKTKGMTDSELAYLNVYIDGMKHGLMVGKQENQTQTPA